MVTTYTENMDWQLDAAELRVLGALMEKEKTTPEYYPMSLNALVNACNQKTNRDPVVTYDEETVDTALRRPARQGSQRADFRRRAASPSTSIASPSAATWDAARRPSSAC